MKKNIIAVIIKNGVHKIVSVKTKETATANINIVKTA